MKNEKASPGGGAFPDPQDEKGVKHLEAESGTITIIQHNSQINV